MKVKRWKEQIGKLICLILVAAVLVTVAAWYVYQQIGGHVSQQSQSVVQQDSPSVEEPVTAEEAYRVSDAEKAILKTRFDALKQVNPETVAYIYAPGTLLDEPVVQTTDNQTYLLKTFDGGYDPYMGTVYMDMDNSPNFSDRLTWLFGHARGETVPDHRMFNDVNFYDQQIYFDQHPYLVVQTPERSYYYKAAYLIIVPEVTDLYRLDFVDDQDFLSHMEQVRQQSVSQNSKNLLQPRDKYLVLSTCRLEDVTMRANLYFRQIPDDELTAFLQQHQLKLTYVPTR